MPHGGRTAGRREIVPRRDAGRRGGGDYAQAGDLASYPRLLLRFRRVAAARSNVRGPRCGCFFVQKVAVRAAEGQLAGAIREWPPR